MYVDFVEYYISAVIGLRHCKKHKCTKLYSAYVAVRDEAFAILTLENNWDRWMSMAVTKQWKTAPVPTKWTVTRDRLATAARKEAHGGALLKEQPQARCYRGWSAQGIH